MAWGTSGAIGFGFVLAHGFDGDQIYILEFFTGGLDCIELSLKRTQRVSFMDEQLSLPFEFVANPQRTLQFRGTLS